PSPGAPRTDPDERVYRIRLLPWVFDGKADARPGMKDARLWEPVVGHLAHPLPGQRMLLAAAPQRPPPKPDDMITEGAKRPRVGRHGVVGIVAGDDRLQPSPLLGEGLLHALAQFVLDLPQLRTSAVPPTFAADLEPALPGPSADVGKAKEVERFRFAEPELGTLRRCEAAERDQPGLLRMQRQRKLRQPLAHHVEKASAVGLVLEADHDVVRITHDHHVASSLAPSPARRPEIEDVVQVDVGQKRRDHRSLARPPLARRNDPVFQDTRLEPFTDQADDARVADPVLDEADEPVLAYRVEEPGNIGVHNVVHLSAVDPDMEHVQRIVLAAARAGSIAEPEEFLLVDRIQQRSGGPLDNLVLKGGDCQRTLSSIGLRNVPTPRGCAR